MDGNDAQAVVKVFAKVSGDDFSFEILVGGGNDADVHINFLGASERTHFPFLQDAIELHLHGQAHVSDLVEEECAAIGGLKKSAAVFVGAGEGALHVTEEFGFEEGFRKCAAVDGHERGFGPRAVLMDGAGHQFLSGSTFSGDQDAAGLRRDGLNELEYLAHARASSNDVIQAGQAADSLAQFPGFGLQQKIFGHLLDRRTKVVQEPIAFDGVAVGAEIHGVDGRSDGGHAGNQDEHGVRREFLAVTQQFHAGHIRHANIGNHDVKNLRGQAFTGRSAVGRHLDAMSLLAEGDLQKFADRFFVVNH